MSREVDLKPIIWVRGEIRTPPFSAHAIVETGRLLRRLQMGEKLSMPSSRPMASIGKGVHELRINDDDTTWRIIYKIESDCLLVLSIFKKKTQETPAQVIDACKASIRKYLGVK